MYKKRQPKEFMQNDRALGCCFYKIKKYVNVLYKSKCYSIINTYNKSKPSCAPRINQQKQPNPNNFTFFNLQTKGLKS